MIRAIRFYADHALLTRWGNYSHVREVLQPIGSADNPKAVVDLNPNEQAFAKIKHWMRIAQKRLPDFRTRRAV